MKIYGNSMSERASKGQGGNDFLFTDYTFLKRGISKLRVYIVNEGNLTHFITHHVGRKPHIETYDTKGMMRGISLQDHEELSEWTKAQSLKPFDELKGKEQNESLYPVVSAGTYLCEAPSCEITQTNEDKKDILFYGHNDHMFCKKHINKRQ